MQYQVPQFIEVEDKIFGPFTARQFLYLLGGAGVTLGAFSLLPKVIALVVSMPFIALSLALAFYQVHGQPFIKVLENGFFFLTSTKLYLWSSERRAAKKDLASSPITSPQIQNVPPVPKLSESKLRELTWSLNIKDQKPPETL